jgi:hypothetical protein
VASLENWLDICTRLYAKGVDVFDGAGVPVTEAGTRDPRVVALTLLARTLGHARAVVLLLDNQQGVEARTITRSAYEGLFWVAALVKKGAAFVDAIELDDITSRKKRATGLLDWAKEQGQITDEQPDLDQPNLEAFRDRLRDEHGKTDSVILLQAAEAGGVGASFIVYRELSNDAAHPSAASLSRHVTLADDDDPGPPFTLHAEPVQDPAEAVDTLELLASALLGVIVAVNEAVGGVDRGERLDGLAANFRQLSASNKADRDRGRA